jgi:hypothetical protein
MNKLTTAISDDLLQEIRDFLDDQADVVAVGTDPAGSCESNIAMRILERLDSETAGEFMS